MCRRDQGDLFLLVRKAMGLREGDQLCTDGKAMSFRAEGRVQPYPAWRRPGGPCHWHQGRWSLVLRPSRIPRATEGGHHELQRHYLIDCGAGRPGRCAGTIGLGTWPTAAAGGSQVALGWQGTTRAAVTPCFAHCAKRSRCRRLLAGSAHNLLGLRTPRGRKLLLRLGGRRGCVEALPDLPEQFGVPCATTRI